MSAADMPAFGRILCEVQDHVATITLNRPDKLNAIDHGPGSMQREVVEAVQWAGANDDVNCIVLTGAGRAFSSGGIMGGEGLEPNSAKEWYRFLTEEDRDNELLRESSKPIIGAINGMCYGAGLMMALHVDLLVAHESATFGLIETRFGSIGADVLVYLVGPQWARFLTITGEIIDADKAKEIGLVIDVFADDEFASKVNDLARRVASLPPDSVSFNRRMINGTLDQMGWAAQKNHARAISALTNSTLPDARAADGRLFSELHDAGWKTYKEARDAPFTPPWLQR